MNRRMIRAHFGQCVLYFSESKGEMLFVADMHPRHAANAASRLEREADFWAKEAGADESEIPLRWLLRQPLFIALDKRGRGVRL